MGAGNAGLREPGELGRGAGAAGGARGAVRPVGSAGGPAQLADQLGQHERAARPVDGPIGLSGGQRIELVEEAGRLLVLALDRADQQGVPGPGAGDVEQPALFGEQRRDPRDGGAGGLRDPGQQVDEPLVAQQAAAQPQVGPGAFLDAGHGDDVPLAPAGGVRREQLDGVAARGAVGQRIARELLLGEVLGEGGDVGAGEPVGEAGGGVEEGEHGVEIAVGGGADGPAAGAGVVPAAVEPAGLPHPPEHLLGALARAGGVTRDRQEGPDPAQRGGLVGGQGVERIRPPRRGRPQGLDQQRIAPDPLRLGRATGDPISALPAPAPPSPRNLPSPAPPPRHHLRHRPRRHATTCLRGLAAVRVRAEHTEALGHISADRGSGHADARRGSRVGQVDTRRLQAQQTAAEAAHPQRVGGAERGGEQRRRGVGIQLPGRAA